jgi:hypothetical protein
MVGAENLLNDGAALALATGELDGIETSLVEEFEVVEILNDFVSRDFWIFFFLAGGEQEVGHNSAMFEERIVLSDDPDFASLNGAILTVDGDATRSGFVEPGDNAKELRFAYATGTKETDNLALHALSTDEVSDFRADIFEDRSTLILEGDVFDFQETFAVSDGGHCADSYFLSKVRLA